MKEPEYPETPQIEFNSIRSETVTNPFGRQIPRINIKLNFKDGDGDLGLSKEDISEYPFNDTLTIVNDDTIVDKTKSNNYFIKAFYKDKNGYVPFANLTFKDGYRFPRLNPDNEKRTLEGELNYYYDIILPISLEFPSYKSGDSLKFEVYVTDRNFNRSNTITTDPVAVYEP